MAEKAQVTGNADFDWNSIGKKQDNYSAEEKAKLDELYSQKLSTIADLQIIEGIVVAKNNREVVVNIGYKSDGVVALSEFRYNPDLKLGDKIEIRPGIVIKDKDGKVKCRPIFSRIVSLFAEQNDLQYAVPGGLIGVGTKVDPTLCRGDRLVGHLLGGVGSLPEIFISIEVNYYLLRALLGVKTEEGKQTKIHKLELNESLLLNIGATSVGARVVAVEVDLVHLTLIHPVCTSEGEKITLSRRVEKQWRLIGWGKILKGRATPITYE